MSQNKIEKISKDVAERLTTAQVVVSLSSALRQLIDNSIDAGSTIIDIRVKNNGFECIEVQDNGSGIETQNFDALCKPHSTSKLTQFSDFDKLVTLGFRGEALNALCAVSTVTIFTRAADSEIGTRLIYDHSGNICNRQSAARELGTTIIVNKLFETLPVRRKELERSQKREFIKLLSTVQSFALLCPHIKILCTNNIAGKKNNIICTPGGTSTVQDVVTNLFGARRIENSKTGSSALIPIQQDSPDGEIMAIHSVPMEEMHFFDLFKIRGFVSNCEHGCGRGTSDRQFVYINNRPVEYTRVCSVINDVYKQFNKNQYPIIVLFIDVPPEKIDVNVTPDKKTVMLEKERHLLAVIRASMMKTYLKIVGSHSTIKSSVEDRRILMLAQQAASHTSFASSKSPSPEDSNDTLLNSTHDDDSLMNTSDLLKQKSVTRSPPAKKPCPMFRREAPSSSKEPSTSYANTIRSQKLENFSFTMEPKRVFVPNKKRENVENALTEDEIRSAVVEERAKQKDPEETIGIEILEQSQESQDIALNDSQCSQNSQNSQCSQYVLRPQQKIKFSMKLLRDAYTRHFVETSEEQPEEIPDENDVLDEITTKIRKEENSDAEKQLSRSLTKEDFNSMKVIGQFNNGFIICRLRGHLFIVDQHASDEKYNFERLQNTAKLTKQPLFIPTALGFGSVQELVIRDNLPIFQANGFDFDFREKDECLKTFLTARPELLSQQLTNSDLEEILSVVSDYPNQMYRPVRIRNIFASKACRKSVMIGKPLNHREMTRIIRHLSKLEQPWNCPHGRPTIRHLASLPNREDDE